MVSKDLYAFYVSKTRHQWIIYIYRYILYQYYFNINQSISQCMHTFGQLCVWTIRSVLLAWLSPGADAIGVSDHTLGTLNGHAQVGTQQLYIETNE